MFTVKHIGLSGIEGLYQTPSVIFHPEAPACEPDEAPDRATLMIEAGGGPTHLQGGTCFVMNEKGKTVARYDLGASMVPLDRDSAWDASTASSHGASCVS